MKTDKNVNIAMKIEIDFNSNYNTAWCQKTQ